MRWLSLILAVVLLSMLGATAFLWIYSRHAAAYIGYQTDDRGAMGNRSGGNRYDGLFASEGQIGFLTYIHVAGWVEPGDPITPRQAARLFWKHGENAGDFPGSLEEISYYRHPRFGLSLYDGDDAGAGNLYTYRGFLIPTWIVTLVLGVPLAIALWQLLRRRFRGVGICRDCGHDVRTQLSGQGGEKCPECGTWVKPI